MASGSGTGTPISSSAIVTVAEVKADLNYTASDQDTHLEALIAIATELAETHQTAKYLTTSVVDTLDRWPITGTIFLRWRPVSSVTSIEYVDTTGATQTWSSDEYQVDTSSFLARIRPKSGYSFPSLYDQMNPVTITYSAGYGASADDVPHKVKAAVRMAVYRWFHGLSDMNQQQPVLPREARDLLGYDRVIHV